MKSLASPAPVLAAVLGIGILCGLDAVVKAATETYPAGQVVAFRFLVGAFVALAWGMMSGAQMPTRDSFRRATVRAAVILATTLMFFTSLTLLPLAEAIAASLVSPFMMLLVSRVLLGEPIPPRALVAIAIGFSGVVVMLGGNVANGGGNLLGYALVLCSALTYAIAMILTRRDTGKDPILALVLSQNVVLTIGAAPFAAIGWVTPDLHGGLLFLAAGTLGTVGHLIFAWAYKHAPASRLAPLEYTSFIWAVLYGFVLFSEVPSLATIAGAALIVAGCLMTAMPGAAPPA